MQSLKQYSINTTSLSDYICESFMEEDESIAKLDPKMQDVAKLRQLVKTWDKFGNEVEDVQDESSGLYKSESNFERVKDMCKKSTTNSAWAKIESMEKEAYRMKSGPERVNAYSKYFDKLFSIAVNSSKKEQKKYGYTDVRYLVSVLTGIAGYIIDYNGRFGGQDGVDKFLGKLITKFEKVTDKDFNSAMKISEIYDKKKISIEAALKEEADMIKNVNDIKSKFKDHKFFVISWSSESASCSWMLPTENFDSFDEAIKFLQENGSVYSDNLTDDYVDKLLRNLVKSKETKALYMCSGHYHFENDQNNVIPYIGYIDDDITPDTEIYIFSHYDKKDRFAGYYANKDISGQFKNGMMRYSDSLWTTHKKKG